MFNEKKVLEESVRMLKTFGILTENIDAVLEDVIAQIKKGSLKADWKFDLQNRGYEATLEDGTTVVLTFMFSTQYSKSGRLRNAGKTRYEAYVEVKVVKDGTQRIAAISLGKVTGEHKREEKDKLAEKLPKLATRIGISDVRIFY